jgi:hypothetical protein
MTGFNNKSQNGGIYGQLKKENDNHVSNYKVVHILDTNFSAQPDSSGIFYFSDVAPGEYTISGKSANFTDMIIEGVNVSFDSISIVDMRSLIKQSFPIKRRWKGKKIKKIDINMKGYIIGTVNIKGLNISDKAYISIEGTPWDAITDSLGNYQIYNIISGSYSITMSLPHYHDIKFYDVKVRDSSVSIVNFDRIVPEIFTENISPMRWIDSYKK